MNSADPTGEINTSDFLKFLFSTLFLFACCLSLILYIPRAVGIVISFLLQIFVLPKNTLFTVGSVQVSPLQARVFFKDIYYQNENASLRIVDGYFTFAFWGYWFQSPNWTTVKEYMIKESLIGTRCRARSNFKFVKGTVIGIEPEKKRVYVQLDANASDDATREGDEDDGWLGEDGASDGTPREPSSERHAGAAADEMDAMTMDSFQSEEVNRPFDLSDPGAVRPGASMNSMSSQSKGTAAGSASSKPSPSYTTATSPAKKGFSSKAPFLDRRHLSSTAAGAGLEESARGLPSRGEGMAGDAASRAGTRGDEIIKLFDANDIRIRSRPGLCQLHINGTRLCIYNATGKYKDLLNGEPYTSTGTPDAGSAGASGTNTSGQASPSSPKTGDRSAAVEEGAGVKAGKKLMNALKGRLQETKDLDKAEDEDTHAHRSAGVEAAKKLQRHQLENRSFLQRFFAFIGAVEMELFATTIDVGGANAPHPYFLHITALRGEGKAFLTRDSVCPLDLYRTAVDFTLQQVDMRMAQMDSKLTENQVMRIPSLRDRAQLMFKGTASRLSGTDEAFAAGASSGVSSDLIRDFGILVDGKDKGNVHILFYRDTPNVYAGEEIRRDALPKTGIEVIIDTPNFRYGPWLEYCRFQMWQYFLPPNYRPLQALEFVVGKPRPNGGFELFVEFMRETKFEVPFKRRAVAPSPPFGIKDSHEKGVLTATIGAGSQYIQKAFFLLPGEDKQIFEALFMGRNITVWSNCVLGRETLFCHADTVQFFLDRQDDILWNGRKLWNILPKISGAEVYFFMLYVDFFLDILNDWQFAPHMYHHVPLSTEMFNTYERAVRDFIPNVKRFEVFLDGHATVYLNVNHHNVVYAQDPCDLTKNTFAILKVQQGSFSMVLPSDQYQLSYENEVVRPLKVSAKELKAYVSLPPTHPLYEQVSMEIPFAYCEHAAIDGSFIINVGNQSMPLDKNPVILETGRTKHTNFLNLEIDFTNMHGTLMGPHIKGLIDTFENIFLDNTMTITPDELFWLLAKLQSHATTGKNKRKEFKQYLESKAPVGNDLEISVLVRITDLEATAATGQNKGAPGILLTTSQLTFTYLKQFACTDTAVVLAPVVARFCDAQGRIPRNSTENFLTTGSIRVGLLKHFGRMPLKPKVHEAFDIAVDGISFEMNMEQLVVLTDIAQTLVAHLQAEDSAWVMEVEEARALAEYAAEQIWKGPQRRQAEMAAHQWRASHAASPESMRDFYDNNRQLVRDHQITRLRLADKSRRNAEFYFYDGSPPTEREQRQLAAWDAGTAHGGHAAAPSSPYPYRSTPPPGTVRAHGNASGERYNAAASVAESDVRLTVDRNAPGGGGYPVDSAIQRSDEAAAVGSRHTRAPLTPDSVEMVQMGGDVGPQEGGSLVANANRDPYTTSSRVSRRQVNFSGDANGEDLPGFLSGSGSPFISAALNSSTPRRRSAGEEEVEVPLVVPLHSVETDAQPPRTRRRRSRLASPAYPGASRKDEFPKASPSRKGGRHPRGYGGGGDMVGSRTSSSGSSSGSRGGSARRSGGDRNSSASDDGEDDTGLNGEPSLAFANSVPRDVALGFAYFMEECNKADDDSKDYGIFFLHVVVTKVNGAVRLTKEGYVSVELPCGLSLAQSTVNDGNSNNRTSVAIKDLGVRGLVSQPSAFARYNVPAAEAAGMGDYVEAFHLQTSLCLRQFVAYPFDGSLDGHRKKQRQFVEANDYEGLIRYAFFPEAAPPSEYSTSQETSVRRARQATGEPTPPPSAAQGGRSTMASTPALTPSGQGPRGVSDPSRERPSTASRTAAPGADASLERGTSASPEAPPTLPRPRRPVALPSVVQMDHPDRQPRRFPAQDLNGDLSAPRGNSDSTGTDGSPPVFALSNPVDQQRRPHAETGSRGVRPRPLNEQSLTTSATAPPQTQEAAHEEGAARVRRDRLRRGPATAQAAALLSDGEADATESSQKTSPRSLDAFGDQSDRSDLFRTFPTQDLASLKADLMTSGARFGTCFSATEHSDFDDTASGSTMSEMENLLATQRLRNTAFAADRVTDTGRDSDGGRHGHQRLHGRRGSGGAGAPTPYMLQEPIPVYCFYRTFYKDEPGDADGPTTLDYRAPPRPTRSRPIRNRTHAYAPLPSVAFFQSEFAHCFPEFVTANALSPDGSDADAGFEESVLTGEGDTPSKRVPFSWALRTADNRERSRNGATTKHFHVETVAPVTVLVTRMAIELAASGTAAYMEATATHEQAAARRNLETGTTLFMASNGSTGGKGNGRRSKQSKLVFKKQPGNKKSRARERQKRWLSEDSIVSLLVPCVEAKLLTSLPVPVENLPNPQVPMSGVYCSTFTVRGIHFYSWQNKPPAGVEVSVDATRRMSASLRVRTLSLVTQIEYEPICREGNLNIRVPGVFYDTSKDTIGVVYCAQVMGSGKQDVVRGSEGGACRVSVRTISVNLTRDMIDYLLALKDEAAQLQQLVEVCLARAREDAKQASAFIMSTSTGSPKGSSLGSPRPWRPLGEASSPREGGGSSSGTRFARRQETEQPRPNPLLSLGLDRGRTVQGKGYIHSITLALIDTRKEGRRIVVDLRSTTTLEIAKPSANFIVMTPHRSRDRNVQLQGVGEVDLVRAMLYPSFLHVAHDRVPQPTAGSSLTEPEASGAATSAPSSPTLSRQPTAPRVPQGASPRNANRVTFSEEHARAAKSESPTPVSSGPLGGGRTAAAQPTAQPLRRATTAQPAPLPQKGTSSTSGSSQGPPPGLSRQTTMRGAAATPTNASARTTSTGEAEDKPRVGLFDSLNLVYNCSFTLRALDVSMLHSEMNYVQLKGKNLMGCAESRAEKVSSRECIQMEALAEVISEPMRARLRRKAQSARERASKSRYAAPPSTTEQQQLKGSACFFTQSLVLHYVADPVIGSPTSPNRAGSSREPVDSTGFPSSDPGVRAHHPPRLTAEQRKQRLMDAQVFVAVVNEVAVSAQTTSQYDITGDQTNIAMHVDKILCDSPYRPNADEVIQPQFHLFVSAWKRAIKGLSNHSTRRATTATSAAAVAAAQGSGGGSRNNKSGPWEGEMPLGSPSASPVAPSPPQNPAGSSNRSWNRAFFLVVQTKTIEAVVSLPQNITQRFILPEMSAFVQGSSDERLSAKLHIHPFTITSKLTDEEPDRLENYAVTLPHIYIMFAQDAIKMTGSVMVDTVAITVTPLFINHTLLTYEKLTSDIFALFSSSIPIDEVPESLSSSPLVGNLAAAGKNAAKPDFTFPPTDPTESLPSEAPWNPSDNLHAQRGAASKKKPAKRQSFLFLLRGVRVSYLTSVTNLRFTVRRANATADSAESSAHRSLQWVVHVTNAQVALVDRNDHDQMVAAVDSMRRQQPTEAAYAESVGSGGSTARDDGEGNGGRLSRYHTRVRNGKSAIAGSTGNKRASLHHGTSPSLSRGYGTKPPNAEEEARRLRAAHPLGGFIWGSAELSFTLSSGKTEQNQAKIALQENASFASYSADLQKALLDSLGHSSSRWELAVYSPLVILRFGLQDLLRMCFDETRDDIGRMKSATAEESEVFRLRLTKNKTFRKLQSEKKRYEALVKRTERERLARLRRMTAQVANDVSRRRGGLALDDEETRLLLDYFNVRTEHRFVATISHFLCVVPFGDVAFRSVVEELPDTYSCGKVDRHIHFAPCLNRRKFIPTLALKMRIEETSLICSLESVKRFVPVLRQSSLSYTEDNDSGNGGNDANAQAADTDYISSYSFCGRFMMNNTYLYFTDGSPLEDETNLMDLITDTSILGGLGVLTEYTTEELRHSRNTLYIASIDSPINVENKGSATRIGAVLDLSGPRVQLSSRLVNILSELVVEAPTEQLVRRFHTQQTPHDKNVARTAPSTEHKDPTAVAPAVWQKSPGEVPISPGGRAGEPLTPAPPTREKPRLHVDVSARLAAGTVKVYAHTSGANLSGGANAAGGGGAGRSSTSPADSKFNRPASSTLARRRVAFAPTRRSPDTVVGGGGASGGFPSVIPRSGHRSSRGTTSASRGQDTSASSVFSRGEEMMESLLAIPLPAVIVQAVVDRGGSIYEEDYAAIKVEVRAGTIELSPSITSLAKEIEACARVYDEFQLARRKNILTKVQSLEKDVATLGIPLHSTLEDVLLPLPSSLCNVLSTLRMRTAIDLKRSSSAAAGAEPTKPHGKDGKQRVRVGNSGEHSRSPLLSGGTSRATSSVTFQTGAPGLVIAAAKSPSKSFTGIHVTLTSFRLILTTEPLASTAFTMFLDEKSSVDLLVKVFQRPSTVSRHFLNKFPDVSAVLAIHSLRAECQTKLEVKSLELYLPEAELAISKRDGTVGSVTALSANVPLNAKGAEPNIILRVQHMYQILAVVQLWTVTLKDTLRSVKRLTARDAPVGVVAQIMKETPLGQKVRTTTTNLKQAALSSAKPSERFMMTACVSHGLVRVDLGSGNTHQLFFGQGYAALESAQHDNGSHVLLLMLRLCNISIRSEGVLGGVASIGGVFCQGFVVRNAEGGLDFVRSPEGRTFRETLAVKDVIVTFKERQLRDIFECKVNSFEGNSMDGIGEEGYTTTDLEVSLSHGTLGVTPSTVPAFLNFVRTVSALVSEQQRVALQKLRGVAGQLFPSSTATNGEGADAWPSHEAPRSARASRSGSVDPFHSSLPDAGSQGSAGGATRRRTSGRDGGERAVSNEGGSGEDRESVQGGNRSVGFIPFMGNQLVRVPCGQLRFTVEETTVMLGSVSTSSDSTAENSVVASFPKARLSFAECPCDDYTAAKKALMIETHHVELYRPGTPRVVIMGFKGVNILDFYTRQVLGERHVGFTLSLRQTHPWTGNPRFRDFEEMIMLIKSFTDKQNAYVFQRFGQVDTDDPIVMAMLRDGLTVNGLPPVSPSGSAVVSGRKLADSFFNEARTPVQSRPAPGTDMRSPSPFPAGVGNGQASAQKAVGGTPLGSRARSHGSAEPGHHDLGRVDSATAQPLLNAPHQSASDVRVLKPLRGTRFSPQLRFGGDVSVNTEVILNWLGITEKMLPNVVNAQLCDKLEAALSALADTASERVVHAKSTSGSAETRENDRR